MAEKSEENRRCKRCKVKHSYLSTDFLLKRIRLTYNPYSAGAALLVVYKIQKLSARRDSGAKRDVHALLCPFSLLSPAKSPKPPFSPAISPQAPNECVKYIYVYVYCVFASYILGILNICLWILCVCVLHILDMQLYMFMDTVCVCVCVLDRHTGHAIVSPIRLRLCHLRIFLSTARWCSV